MKITFMKQPSSIKVLTICDVIILYYCNHDGHHACAVDVYNYDVIICEKCSYINEINKWPYHQNQISLNAKLADLTDQSQYASIIYSMHKTDCLCCKLPYTHHYRTLNNNQFL